MGGVIGGDRGEVLLGAGEPLVLACGVVEGVALGVGEG